MQGHHLVQMPLFVDGNLEKLVPQGHLLRKVARALDLRFVRRLTRKHYAGAGRPSLDPVVYFKMQIIAYLYGIESDRRLCDEVSCNLAYRWYLGYPLDTQTPDHSTMSRARDRLGEEVFRKVFERVVVECAKVGLIKGQQIISDATLIKADAAKKSLKKNDEPDDNEGGSSKKSRNKTHTSTTDPESSCVNRPGYNGDLFYKAHYSIDGKKRVITDCHVTTGALHECNVLTDRIDHVKKTFGFDIKEALADSGYGHGPTFEYLKENEIRSYIPLRDKKLGAGKHSPSKEFKCDRKNDRYKCPGGHFMYPHSPANGITRYVIKNKECLNCPLKRSCFPEDYKLQSRRIQRSQYQDLYDAIRRRLTSKTFTSKMRERSWKIEGIFGEAKDNHCLRRARYRGRVKVQIQVYLSSMTQNIKRLVYHRKEAFFAFIRSILIKGWTPEPKKSKRNSFFRIRNISLPKIGLAM